MKCGVEAYLQHFFETMKKVFAGGKDQGVFLDKSTVPQLVCGRFQFFPSSIFKNKIFSIGSLCCIHCSQDKIRMVIHVAGFRFFSSSIYRAKTFPIGNLYVKYFYRTSYCRFQFCFSHLFIKQKKSRQETSSATLFITLQTI